MKQVKRNKQKQRADGFNNVVLGKGRMVTDTYSNFSMGFSSDFLSDEILTDNFMKNGIVHKIIAIPAEDALRKGFSIKSKDDTYNDEPLQSIYEDLHLKEKCIDALTWDRLYGGVLVVFLVDDGGTLDEELNYNAVKSIAEMRVYDAASVTVQEQNLDTSSLDYRQPVLYMVQNEYGGSFTVHASRCIWLDGEAIPPFQRKTLDRRGGKVLDRINRDVLNYNVTLRNVLMIIERISQGVLKFSGMTNILQTPEGEELIRKRVHQVDMSRSIDNTVVIDSEDDYQQHNLSVSGLNQILQEYQTALSAVSEIPVTVLFGRSPGGLSATGESDLENYYNMISRIQETKLKPIILYVNNLLSVASDVTAEVPQEYNIEFNPLWNLSDKEEAEVSKMKIDTEKVELDGLVALYGVGALTSDEIRNYVAKKDKYDIEGD